MNDLPVMLITGTRKGIGQYLASYYSNNGYLVEGCSRKDSEFSHSNYHHHNIDVTKEQQVKEMLSDISKRRKRLDVLLNNAGVAGMNHILLTPSSLMEKIINTNFYGTVLLTRESIKLMKKRKFGRIVNFSTIAVPMQLAGEAIYGASKSAVETFSKIIAKEIADFGITCNVIGPSPINTDLIRSVPKEKIDSIVSDLTIKRPGEFSDISNVIDFFIKPQSGYITGQIIYLGGLS